MSKYNVEEVVKFTKRPGLFVITQIGGGPIYLEYSLMTKSAFDNWNPEVPDTFPEEHEIFNSVSEADISKIF